MVHVLDTMQLDKAVDMYSTTLHARTPRTIEHAVDKGIELENIPEHCLLATSMAGLSTATGTCKHAINRWLSHQYIDINTCERAVYTHVCIPTRTPMRALCVRPRQPRSSPMQVLMAVSPPVKASTSWTRRTRRYCRGLLKRAEPTCTLKHESSTWKITTLYHGQ